MTFFDVTDRSHADLAPSLFFAVVPPNLFALPQRELTQTRYMLLVGNRLVIDLGFDIERTSH